MFIYLGFSLGWRKIMANICKKKYEKTQKGEINSTLICDINWTGDYEGTKLVRRHIE